jgi:hypothetical protein
MRFRGPAGPKGQRLNYAETTIRHYIRTVEDFARRFNLPARPFRPAAHSRISSGVISETEIVAEFGWPTSRGSAILLHQDAEEGVEHCRDSLSEMGIAPTNDPQPGRSCTTHRRGSDSFSSDSVDDALRYR